MSPDITSPTNERIKWLVRLRERRHRDDEGVFVVEGERLYRRALETGLRPRVSFVSVDANIDTLGETVTVAPSALDKASYRNRADDVVAVFPQLDTRLERVETSGNPLLLIAENVGKPGNLGAMLRTAAVAGADALIAVGGTPDPHNPNAVRASTGALFTTDLAVSPWDELEPWLEHRHVEVLCSTPAAAEPIWDVDLTGAVALVVGAEDAGVSERAMAVADRTVHIPQATGTVDSLNVSVAAGVLLFEARRQRRSPAGPR